jgi:hypothetical protein
LLNGTLPFITRPIDDPAYFHVSRAHLPARDNVRVQQPIGDEYSPSFYRNRVILYVITVGMLCLLALAAFMSSVLLGACAHVPTHTHIVHCTGMARLKQAREQRMKKKVYNPESVDT